MVLLNVPFALRHNHLDGLDRVTGCAKQKVKGITGDESSFLRKECDLCHIFSVFLSRTCSCVVIACSKFWRTMEAQAA